MIPYWLLETDTFLEGNPQRMFGLLKVMNLPVQWIKYIPFDGMTFTQYPAGSCVILYGSLNLAAAFAKSNPWTPGIWSDPHALRTSTYLAHWGRFSLQRDYALYPLGEIKRLLPQLLERFGNEGKLFLRPNENDKSFSGTVISQNTFDRWLDQNTRCYNLDSTSIAVVSRPQKILSEHRFIVADDAVITGSKYRRGENLLDGADAAGFDPAARDFAQQVVNSTRWQPQRLYALDIAETSDGYALLEIGSPNSCGLYGCNLELFIQHASRIARDVWEKASAQPDA